MKSMKKNLSFLILFFFTLCFSQEEYLQQLKRNIEINISDQKKLKEIAESEKEKFDKTRENLYYISYKYALLYTYGKDRQSRTAHFVTLTDLLRANDDQYSLIATDVYFSLAFHLENYSTDMSLEYLNKAIENEIKIKNSLSIPHLYHMKGRFYYNMKKYDEAMKYFNKTLSTLRPTDYLYISSMHNNFGLVYQKQGKYNLAIKEFNEAITILLKQKVLTDEDSRFLLHIYENLAQVYLALNKTKEAEILLEKLFNENKEKADLLSNVVVTSDHLYKIYKADHNQNKISSLISFLENIKHKSPDHQTSLYIYEILLNHNFENKNYEQAKQYHFKVLAIKDSIIADNKKAMNDLGNTLNKTIIKNTNQKYDYQIQAQRRQTQWIIFISIIIITSLVFFYISIKNKIKKNTEISNQQKIITDQKEFILEQNLKIQDEKIKNLHLNLNLKQETAKAFLEKIKKARKSNTNNSDDILKNLYFDLNNLVHIDKRNTDFTEESISENKNFVKKLSEAYPQLSDQELQLCVYFRLSLSAKEISMLEKISDGTVRVYKSKIKTKMGLDKDRNLEEVLSTI